MLCASCLSASRAKVKARYVLLEQAITRGTLTITEVSEAGSVPYLQAVNKGPWPVLIFDGEELVGAKQNRIANATILVGVGKTVLPVSCVEAGPLESPQPSLRLGRVHQPLRLAPGKRASGARAHESPCPQSRSRTGLGEDERGASASTCPGLYVRPRSGLE